jgi:hypothetical protein
MSVDKDALALAVAKSEAETILKKVERLRSNSGPRASINRTLFNDIERSCRRIIEEVMGTNVNRAHDS